MISAQQIVVRLALAAVLGSIVGLERERLDRAAGLRTHALVAVGAALFMLVSAFGFADMLGVPQVGLALAGAAPAVLAAAADGLRRVPGVREIALERGGERSVTISRRSRPRDRSAEK